MNEYIFDVWARQKLGTNTAAYGEYYYSCQKTILASNGQAALDIAEAFINEQNKTNNKFISQARNLRRL